MLTVARAASETAKTSNCTLEGGGAVDSVRAGGKPGLVGFRRLHFKPYPPIWSACGAKGFKRRALRNRPEEVCGTERVTSPAPLLGVLRGVPARRGSGRRDAAPAQGKAFPKVTSVSQSRTDDLPSISEVDRTRRQVVQ